MQFITSDWYSLRSFMFHSSPSIAPVPAPSLFPTSAPTSFDAHTNKPITLGQTYTPSSAPTAGPSRDYNGYQDTTLYTIYKELISKTLANSFSFSSFTYKDQPINSNSCANWQYFSENVNNLPIPGVEYLGVNLTIYNENLLDNTFSSSQYSCSSLDITNFIAGKISTGTQFLVFCNGHYWRQYSCSGNNIVCVDCKKNCNQCAGASYIMQPCENKACNTETASLSSISFSLRRKITYPQLTSSVKVLSASRGSVVISVNLTRPGLLYCLAYSKSLLLVSTSIVKSSGFQLVLFSLISIFFRFSFFSTKKKLFVRTFLLSEGQSSFRFLT